LPARALQTHGGRPGSLNCAPAEADIERAARDNRTLKGRSPHDAGFFVAADSSWREGQIVLLETLD
jgi:hypothetical protein